MLELGDFHLLRFGFLALFPLGLALVWLIHLSRTKDERMVDVKLRDYVVIGRDARSRWWRNALLISIVFISLLSLAGPGWRSVEVPVQRNANPTFIALDLSLSMAAQDLQPNRYRRAIFAIRDLIADNPEGAPYSLIAYAGSAWRVTPLSFDATTIENFLDALDPQLLPEGGSNPISALELIASTMADEKNQLSKNIDKVTVVLISDDLSEQKQQIVNTVKQQGWDLVLIAAGKKNSVPVTTSNGTLLRDSSGELQLASYNPQSFVEIARQTGAQLASVDASLGAIVNLSINSGDAATDTIKHQQLADQGYFFVLLLLPLFLLAMRRGMFGIFLILLLNLPNTSQAFSWQDLWQSKDNQALQAIESGKYTQAEQLAQDPLLLGSAKYRQDDYAGALMEFSQVASAIGKYNAGNAAFQLGNFNKAIELYQQALGQQPEERLLGDIEHNLKLAEQNLKQQKQQQQSGEQDQQQGQSQQQQQSGEQNQQQGQNQQQQQSGEQDQQQGQSQQQQQSGEQNQQQGQSQQQQQLDEQTQQQQNIQSQNNSVEREQSQQNQTSEQAAKSGEETNQQQSPTFSDTRDKRPEDSDQDGQLLAEQSKQSFDNSGDGQVQVFQELDSRSKLLLNRVEDNPAELLRRLFWMQQQRSGKSSSNQQPSL